MTEILSPGHVGCRETWQESWCKTVCWQQRAVRGKAAAAAGAAGSAVILTAAHYIMTPCGLCHTHTHRQTHTHGKMMPTTLHSLLTAGSVMCRSGNSCQVVTNDVTYRLLWHERKKQSAVTVTNVKYPVFGDTLKSFLWAPWLPLKTSRICPLHYIFLAYWSFSQRCN